METSRAREGNLTLGKPARSGWCRKGRAKRETQHPLANWDFCCTRSCAMRSRTPAYTREIGVMHTVSHVCSENWARAFCMPLHVPR